MNKFKTCIIAAALGVSAPASFATGIPTVDAAAIAQAVNQILELQKQYEMLTSQLEEMQRQYQQMKDLTDKLNSISGIAEILRDPERLEVFPNAVEGIWDWSYDAMEAGAKSVYTIRNFGDKCATLEGELKEGCEQEMAYTASAEYEYVQGVQKVREKFEDIDFLIDAIGTSETAKEIQDLQARIQGELGHLQVAGMQIELNKATLEAAKEGARKMQEAGLMKYFNTDTLDLSDAFN